MSNKKIVTVRVETEEDRAAALAVLDAVFRQEKGWLRDPESELPPGLATGERTSWFVSRVDGEPAGLIRLLYDPPLELPPDFEATFEEGLDLARLARDCRFVEIGRFMVVESHRRSLAISLELIRAAVREVALRGYTHFLTDVYEGDPHSPLDFHTRILGFERIGTHLRGELDCPHRRIILMLDLAAAYRRLKAKNNKVFRRIGEGLAHVFEAPAAVKTA